MFRSDLCVHKVIKGWSSYRAAWFTDIRLLEEVYRATRASAGIVHAVEGPVIHKLIQSALVASAACPSQILPMTTTALSCNQWVCMVQTLCQRMKHNWHGQLMAAYMV